MASRKSSSGSAKKPPAADPRGSGIPVGRNAGSPAAAGGFKPDAAGDAAAAKLAGAEAVGRQFPFNAAKASEFGDSGATPGQHEVPPDPLITGSTLDGEGDVVAGWKNKLQAAMASITPSAVLAEQHRKMAEPGTGQPSGPGQH
jgi:hypothetical protein